MKKMIWSRIRRHLPAAVIALVVFFFAAGTVSAADSLTTDRTQYALNEPIMVTASCSSSGAWVGLYKAGDVPGVGEGTQESFFWYYTADHNGTAFDIKRAEANSRKDFTAGEYKLVLFGDSGYSDVLKIVEITLTDPPEAQLKPLQGLSYEPDCGGGFANGFVTADRSADNSATECTLYWADASGQPLEGYTGLFKFHLTGSVTETEMYPYTIIPPGARKLIGYAGDGTNQASAVASATLPENCSYDLDGENPLCEFQMVSDIHVNTSGGSQGVSNGHFTMMLNDIKANSPDSIGIFINGDIADTGSSADFDKVWQLYNAAGGTSELPVMHMAVGNHDWFKGNPDDQFQKYAYQFNQSLGKAPEKVYYTEVVEGIPFIYLGQESSGNDITFTDEQLDWFDAQMEQYTAEDPDRPVFVLLHQSMINTVAGSLNGQGWNGVTNEMKFKERLKKYGQIILLNGHSHWELTSPRCMYPGSSNIPVAFNTAAVGYLWSSYNTDTGQYVPGTQGYYVRVYEDRVEFLGRDFEHQKFIPSAMFVVKKNKITMNKNEYFLTTDSGAVDLGVSLAEGGSPSYTISDTDVVTVNSAGKAIVLGKGDAEILVNAPATATSVIDRKTIQIHVTDPPEGDADILAVVDIIEALPADITLENKAEVEAARAAFENLPESKQGVFPGEYLARLKCAEAWLEVARAKADEAVAKDAAEQAIAAAQTEADKAKAEADRLRAEADTAKAEAAAAQTEADKAKAEADRLRAEADTAKAEAAAAQAEAERAKAEAEKATGKDATEALIAVEEAQEAARQAKRRAEVKEAEAAAAQAEADKAKAEAAAAQAEADAARAEADRLRAEAENNAEIEALKQEIERLNIRLTSVKGLKVKAKKGGKALVTFKSAGDGFTYQIKYSTKKKSGFKTITTDKNKLTVRKLKKKKNYFFKVTAFKTVGGKTVFTGYSKVVRIKTK